MLMYFCLQQSISLSFACKLTQPNDLLYLLHFTLIDICKYYIHCGFILLTSFFYVCHIGFVAFVNGIMFCLHSFFQKKISKKRVALLLLFFIMLLPFVFCHLQSNWNHQWLCHYVNEMIFPPAFYADTNILTFALLPHRKKHLWMLLMDSFFYCYQPIS